MNKKLFVLTLFTLLATSCIYAQHVDTVAIRINGKPISKHELERAYRKSNVLRPNEEKESITDFAWSYIDFKLNVEEAKAQRLDTTGNYIRDLSMARVEASRKYMYDTIYENDYLQKIYKRMQEDVEINHVLVPFDGDRIYPSDTVALFKKALELRGKLSKNGFTAASYDQSLPTSPILNHNKRNGYIGWITPFMFRAKVEDAIYSLPIHEISQPIRTADGYHIVQVLNKRQAKGAIDLEQVLFNFPHIPANQHQIDSVSKVAWREYKNIRSATDYKSLCDEFAKVMEMGDKGCRFGIINLESNLSPTFVNAAFNLEKEGDVSEPVMSDYGYHIIRLLKKIPSPSYTDIKKALRERILKNDKSQEMTNERRNKMSKVLNFRFNKDAYNKLNEVANKVSPKDSAFFDLVKNGNEVLFSFGDKEKHTVNNLIDYIKLRHSVLGNKSSDSPEASMYTETINNSLSTDILNDYFNAYYSRCLTDYYYYTLADREPEYREQLEEVSDGLLAFAIMNAKVWSHSATNQKELVEHFNQNKKKYSLNGTKYRGLIIHAKDEKTLSVAQSLAKNEKNRDALITKIRNTLNKDSLRVLMQPGIWVKGENQYVDNKIFGGKEAKTQIGYPSFWVIGDFISKPVDYTDVRNAVEADYQHLLEKKWKTFLRKKYKVEINNSILETIK